MISCTESLDLDKFKDYGLATARLYVSLYPWYYMPSSLHEIFIHGSEIMRKLKMPIDYYSEQAPESNNKNIKKFREHYSRKTKR